MKKLIILAILILTALSCSQPKKLDTKLIASKYKKGIVKILMFDSKRDKMKKGAGYLTRGSGFFVTEDGYIFTNRHVIETSVKGYIDYDYRDKNGAKKSNLVSYSENIYKDKNFIKAFFTGYTQPIIQVFNSDNETDYKLYKAEVVSMSTGVFDGALLKVVSDIDDKPVTTKFTAIPIGDSDKVLQGESLCVYGFPAQILKDTTAMLNDMSTLSIGIMSGLDYNFNADYGFIKTDAEIHPGNSGGPVFNEENKVIGIATAKGNRTGIGLVGGINGMYYITATDSKAHKTLVSNGLKLPERSISINSQRGTKLPIKTVGEINKYLRKNEEIKSSISKYLDIYKNSKLFFSNVSIKNNNNLVPSYSRRYNLLSIDRNRGGYVWIYIDNRPNTLNTNQVKIKMEKLYNNGKYYKYGTDRNRFVSKNAGIYHFSHVFKESGTYRITAYSDKNQKIASESLQLVYN